MARKKQNTSFDKEKWYDDFVDTVNYLELDPKDVVKEARSDWAKSNIALFTEGGDFYRDTVSDNADVITSVLHDKEIDMWFFELKGLGINEQEARRRLDCKNFNRNRLYTMKNDFQELIGFLKKRMQIPPSFRRIPQHTFRNIVTTYLSFLAEHSVPIRQTDIADELGVSQTVISKLQKSDTQFQYRFLECIDRHLFMTNHFICLYYATVYIKYRLSFQNYYNSKGDLNELFSDGTPFISCDPFYHDDVSLQLELIGREPPENPKMKHLGRSSGLFWGVDNRDSIVKYLNWLVSLDSKTQELLLKAPHIFLETSQVSFTDLKGETKHMDLFELFDLFRKLSKRDLLTEKLTDNKCDLSNLLGSEDAAVLLREYLIYQKFQKMQTIQVVSDPDRLVKETCSIQRDKFMNVIKEISFAKGSMIANIYAPSNILYTKSLLMLNPSEMEQWIMYRLKIMLDEDFLKQEYLTHKRF